MVELKFVSFIALCRALHAFHALHASRYWGRTVMNVACDRHVTGNAGLDPGGRSAMKANFKQTTELPTYRYGQSVFDIATATMKFLFSSQGGSSMAAVTFNYDLNRNPIALHPTRTIPNLASRPSLTDY
ncbi:hypothetical protein V1520DRAFT_329109 [Lipomyces starkeyi]